MADEISQLSHPGLAIYVLQTIRNDPEYRQTPKLKKAGQDILRRKNIALGASDEDKREAIKAFIVISSYPESECNIATDKVVDALSYRAMAI